MTLQTKKKNKEKMTFNTQWLEKYSFVAVRREVWCYYMLTMFE